VDRIAADLQRHQIEKNKKNTTTENNNTFDVLNYVNVEHDDDIMNDSIYPLSYFNDKGEPVDSKIVLPESDHHLSQSLNPSIGTTKKKKKRKNNTITMQNKNKPQWFSHNDIENRRKILNNIVNCNTELDLIANYISMMSRKRLLLQLDYKKYNVKLSKFKYNLQLIQNMVEDVQTVENVEKKNKADQLKNGTGSSGGGGSDGNRDSLTKITNSITKLWKDSILATVSIYIFIHLFLTQF